MPGPTNFTVLTSQVIPDYIYSPPITQGGVQGKILAETPVDQNGNSLSDGNGHMEVVPKLGSLARGQNDLIVTGRVATSASVTTTVPLGAVPAGKTFYLTDIFLSTVTTNEVDVQLQYTLGGQTVTIFRSVFLNTSPVNGPGIQSKPSAPAGAVLQLLLPVVTGAPNVDFSVGGVYQ